MALSIKCDSLALRTESREECMICFPNSDHVMFSREFASCLVINYAYIGTWMHVYKTTFEKKNSSLGYKLKKSILLKRQDNYLYWA